MASDPKQTIEGEVISVVTMQQELATVENELMQVEAFQKFIALRKSVNDKMDSIRANVEFIMVPAYKAGKVDKTIKGDWGSVTVTERDDFVIDEATLPAKFFKKVPDTTKIRKTYQLEGKPPKGAEPSKKYGVMIKFK